jgi:hypothetical protein
MKNVFARLVILCLLASSCDNRQTVKMADYTIPKGATIQRGAPADPLPNSVVTKLIENFKKDSSISEVYEFGQTRNKEFSIVLGFRLTDYSEKFKKSAIASVRDVLEGENVGILDMCFLENEADYEEVSGIQNSLIYIR